MPRKNDAPEALVTTPDVLAHAPGFIARRLYQSYLAAWSRAVDNLLTGPQFAVLSVLQSHPGADQASVAAAAAVDPSTMAEMARRLERRHLLVRTTSMSDGRRKVLQLTSLGEEVLIEARARAEDLNKLLAVRSADGCDVEGALSLLANHWEAVARDLVDQGATPEPIEPPQAGPRRTP